MGSTPTLCKIPNSLAKSPFFVKILYLHQNPLSSSKSPLFVTSPSPRKNPHHLQVPANHVSPQCIPTSPKNVLKLCLGCGFGGVKDFWWRHKSLLPICVHSDPPQMYFPITKKSSCLKEKPDIFISEVKSLLPICVHSDPQKLKNDLSNCIEIPCFMKNLNIIFF